MKTLDKYRKNVFSQNGEDGVIEEVLRRIELKSGHCVEFGAWDGKHLSNTHLLVRQGWHGTYIEGDTERFKALQKLAKEFPNQINAICRFVDAQGENSLDNILHEHHVTQCDLLSIDIDSYDWQVWASFRSIKPAVVIIEINSAQKPGIRQVHQNEHVCGSSFSSTLELGKQKGYELVCHTGNMIFVRNDLVNRVGLSEIELQFPEVLFDYSWFQYSPRYRALMRQLRAKLRIDF